VIELPDLGDERNDRGVEQRVAEAVDGLPESARRPPGRLEN
jgi:hypothetical protein